MTAQTEQDELVQRFRAGQRELAQTVEGLSDQLAQEVWYGSWGVREIVAHIAGWEEALAEALSRIARGERPGGGSVDLSDVDGTNAGFARNASSESFRGVLQQLERAGEQLVDAIRAMPSDRISEGKTGRRIIETTINHPAEHVEAIREWRRTSGAE